MINNQESEFLKAIGDNDFKKIKLLMNDLNIDPACNYDCAIKHSAEYGYIEIVDLLLKDKRIDPSDEGNWAIGMASENGHAEIVELLLKNEYVDAADDYNYAILNAFSNSHFKIVKLLWNDVKVRDTLKKDSIEIYNQLINQDIVSKKVSEFSL